MKIDPTTTKPISSKQSEIAASLRRQIVLGRHAPGSRLPTWDELEKRFDVSRPTLRLALGDLKAQGFIEPDSTRGTFVARRPPCQHRYGLAFYEIPGTPRWNRFYAALTQQAGAMPRGSDRQLEVFHNVNATETSETHRKILDDERNHCFAGLIQVGAVSLMPDPAWQAMKLPRVAIAKPPNHPSLAWLPSIGMDWPAFWQKSLDYLESRGRKRIATLSIDFHPQPGLCELARQRGFVAKPSWHHVGSLQYPQAAGHITQLLMDPTLGEKPDAIIITDDNLAEAAIGGLLASGVRVGEDVDVIAHCCWPWPVPMMPQVQRLGFDAEEILTAALDLLDAQRAGNHVTGEKMVSPRFENERVPAAVPDAVFED